MISPKHFALWFLLSLCTLPAVAQQLYIKNQPFEGKVVKDSGSLWVELRPLELALGFDAKLEAEGARIEGRLVRTLQQGEVLLVSLSQAAAALGAVVRENPEFGTIDLHMAVRPKSGTSGLDVSSSPSSGPAAGEGDKTETAAFAFVVPEQMQVTRDPRLIRAFLEEGGPPLKTDFKFDALVYYKGDVKYKKGAAVLTWLSRDVPKEMESEQTLLAYQFDVATVVLDDMGVELVKPPEVMETGGQRFVLGAGVDRAPPHNGMLLLLRIDAKKKRFYQVITSNIPQDQSAPTTDFLEFMASITTK